MSALQRQKGAVAMEFALAFPLFFALFYAIVSYSLVMTLEQSMTNASMEGTRAAVAVDVTAYDSSGDYQTAVAALARARVAKTLSWVPPAQKEVILGSAPTYDNVNVEFVDNGVSITLNYPYSQAPILPIMVLPIIGNIPNLPATLTVSSDTLL